MWQEHGLATRRYYQDHLAHMRAGQAGVKYGSSPDDLLRESAFCLIPAAPIAHYLDTDPGTNPSMTVAQMGHWSVIIEGANTYSPDPARRLVRARMERAVYRQEGVLIATDYLVNSGGVIYAAQEHLIKTPEELRIPASLLGDRRAVDAWLLERATQFEELADRRLQAAKQWREDVMRANMRELVDLLVSDADMLPCEAAERLSVRRIAARESDRTASEIMAPIPTIPSDHTIKQAASLLIETGCPILAVLKDERVLAGVVTEWDITRAAAGGPLGDACLDQIMTREVIAAGPEDNILSVVHELELNEISAMPVVDGGEVLGMVSADLLARRSLLRLLQTQLD
jgi:glutamate dehydrogenase (NAD(P)+)